MRLLLARHGETTWNLERRYQGQGNSPLSPLGEEQARCLASRLAGDRLDAIYSSDLQRAWRTADVVAAGRGLEVVRKTAWREIGYGDWEGLTLAEIQTRFPEAWALRQSDPMAAAPPGGERRSDVLGRAIAAARKLRERHHEQSVLVVTHGGLLALLGCWLQGIDVAAGLSPRSSNCGLSCVVWTGLDPVLEFWDDVSHMEQPSQALSI